MAAKPTTFPRWGETAAGALGPTEIVPSSAKQDVGWSNAEEPPAGYMNWLQRLAYKWLQYVSDAVFIANAGSGLAGVEATGDGAAPAVKANGKVQASTDFTYQAARTERFHVTALDGQGPPGGGTAALTFSVNVNAYNWRASASNPILVFKCRLPQGATITGIDLLLGNSNTATATCTSVGCIVYTYAAGGSYTTVNVCSGQSAVIPASGTLGLESSAWIAVGGITPQTVPAEGWVQLQLQLPNIAGQFSSFTAARITYTIPHLKPAAA